MLAAIERDIRLFDKLVAFLERGFLDEHIEEVTAYLRGELAPYQMFELMMQATRHNPHTVVMRRVCSLPPSARRRETDAPSLRAVVYEEATWECQGRYLRDNGSHPPPPPALQWKAVPDRSEALP